MSERFGPAASRLAGLSARALGWRPQDFWFATPAEFAAALAPPQVDGEPLDRETFDKLMGMDNDRNR